MSYWMVDNNQDPLDRGYQLPLSNIWVQGPTSGYQVPVSNNRNDNQAHNYFVKEEDEELEPVNKYSNVKSVSITHRLLPTFCPSSVHLLSIFCLPSVHLLSILYPPSVHLLSIFCPSSVHFFHRSQFSINFYPFFVHRLLLSFFSVHLKLLLLFILCTTYLVLQSIFCLS